MKKIIVLLPLIVFAISIHAQNKTCKNNFSAGYGFQNYNGDLGNTFFDFDEEWYGVAKVGYGRYLTPSFDAMATITSGDFGHCYDGPQDADIPAAKKLNLRSRLATYGVVLKYKFTNGYLLKEDAKFTPFIYAGSAINTLKDTWSPDGSRVNDGTYITINAGAGVGYNITHNLQLVYNIGFGYFTSDKLDFISKGSNDMYMQNTLCLSFSLF